MLSMLSDCTLATAGDDFTPDFVSWHRRNKCSCGLGHGRQMSSAVKYLESSMIQSLRLRLQADMGFDLCGLHKPPGDD